MCRLGVWNCQETEENVFGCFCYTERRYKMKICGISVVLSVAILLQKVKNSTLYPVYQGIHSYRFYSSNMQQQYQHIRTRARLRNTINKRNSGEAQPTMTLKTKNYYKPYYRSTLLIVACLGPWPIRLSQRPVYPAWRHNPDRTGVPFGGKIT